MMKRILLTMSIGLFMSGAIYGQGRIYSMKPDKNEAISKPDDTIKVEKEYAETVCFSHPMPSFPGNLNQFFREKLLWPGGRENKNVEGRVVVNFRIDRDGTCSQFKIVRSLNPDFDVEVIRVLLQMPKWVVHPLTQGGTWFTMPITFKK